MANRISGFQRQPPAIRNSGAEFSSDAPVANKPPNVRQRLTWLQPATVHLHISYILLFATLDMTLLGTTTYFKIISLL